MSNKYAELTDAVIGNSTTVSNLTAGATTLSDAAGLDNPLWRGNAWGGNAHGVDGGSANRLQVFQGLREGLQRLGA